MLIIVRSIRQLQISQFMEIYRESNMENAAIFFPYDPPGVALTMAEQEFVRYLRDDFFKNSEAFYAIWTEENLWVSALRMEPYKDGFLLEALETHPDHRKKGYATSLIKAVQQIVSAPIYSHVSKKNVSSLAVHKACDFHKLKEYAVYVDGSVSDQAFTMYYHK